MSFELGLEDIRNMSFSCSGDVGEAPKKAASITNKGDRQDAKQDADSIGQWEASWKCQDCQYINSSISSLCAQCGGRRYTKCGVGTTKDSSAGARVTIQDFQRNHTANGVAGFSISNPGNLRGVPLDEPRANKREKLVCFAMGDRKAECRNQESEKSELNPCRSRSVSESIGVDSTSLRSSQLRERLLHDVAKEHEGRILGSRKQNVLPSLDAIADASQNVPAAKRQKLEDDGAERVALTNLKDSPFETKASNPLSSTAFGKTQDREGSSITWRDVKRERQTFAQDETMTFTNVFRIINIEINKSDQTRLIHKFGDNAAGVHKFVSLIGVGEQNHHEILSMYNITESDGRRLCFFRSWFEQEYLSASQQDKTKPDFTEETWRTFCKSIVEQRKVIPILFQNRNENGVIICDEASEDLSSLTPSHQLCSRSQGAGTGGHEGGRGCAILSPRSEIVIEHNNDPNKEGEDCDTSVLTTKITNHHNDPENIGSLLEQMRDNLDVAEMQFECCGDIKTLLWDRGGFLRHQRLQDVVGTMLQVLKAHSDHPTITDQVVSVLEACCDVESGSNVKQRIPVLLEGLRQYEDNAPVQAHSFRALITLAATKGDHRVSIELAGGIEWVIEMMRKHLPWSAVQSNGCTLLSMVARAKSCQRAIVSSKGLVGIVVMAMERHLPVFEVQATACNLLSTLLSTIAHTDNVREEIVAEHGLSFVVAALQYHSRSSVVCEQGILLLCRLANLDQKLPCQQFLRALVKCLQIEDERLRDSRISAFVPVARDDFKKRRLLACAILGSMQLQESNQKHQITSLMELSDESTFQSWIAESNNCLIPRVLMTVDQDGTDTCRLLANLAFCCVEGTIAVRVIPRVVAAMLKHPSHVGLQTNACRMFTHLAWKDRWCEAIVAGATIPIVVAAMRQHMSHFLLQDSACSLLKSLSYFGGEDCCKTIVAAGGIPRVLVAMQQHLSCLGLQENACSLLINLAGKMDGCKAIVTEDGIATVVAAMQQPSSHVDLQMTVCSLLERLAETKDGSEAIVAADGVRTAVATMRQHSSYAALQVSACRFLTALAYFGGQDCRRALVAEECIPQVVLVMKLHLSCVDFQVTACWLLGILATFWKEECFRAIVKAREIPSSVVTAMQQYPSHVGLQERACCLLRKVGLLGEQVCCQAIVAAGGIQAVMAAMRQDLSNALVQQVGCWVLGNLAWEVSSKIVIDVGAIPTVLLAMQEHQDDAQVQHSGCWALATACGNWCDSTPLRVVLTDPLVIDALLVAMNYDDSHADIQHLVFRALEHLAGHSVKCRCYIRDQGGVALVRQAASNSRNDYVRSCASDALRALLGRDDGSVAGDG